MTFKQKIIKLEEQSNHPYIIKDGTIPILLTAPHTMKQKRLDGTVKVSEPFTRAIAKYVSEKTNCSYLTKEKDTLIDSNWEETDAFKVLLEEKIKNNQIKLVIDIHGANRKRNFDIELGTLNNLSADFSTIMELKEAFEEKGIVNIEMNHPFKGGGITKYIYGITNIDIIQIEINAKYRDVDNIENMEKICNALIKFINQYASYQNKKNI